MKSEKEVRHLLMQAKSIEAYLRKQVEHCGSSRARLNVLSGYVQGLHFAAGQIALLAGDSLEQVDQLDELMEGEPEYTHVDADGNRWRFIGANPISEVSDRALAALLNRKKGGTPCRK